MDKALAAIQAGDDALAARLYLARALEVNDQQARAYYATHAYVHALVAGLEDISHQAEDILKNAKSIR